MVFWKLLDLDETSEQETEKVRPKRVPTARDSLAFNADSVHGYEEPEEATLCLGERISQAEEFVPSLEIDLRSGGNLACYAPETYSLHKPAFEAAGPQRRIGLTGMD